MSNSDFAYHRPKSLDEALELVASEANRLVAGGTDLMVQMRQRRTSPRALVSLRRVTELQGIATDGDELVIGAGTPLAAVLDSDIVREWAPALTAAMEVFASPQIRNVATLGGNLGNASPAADAAPPLLVYDATIDVRSAGASRAIAIGELFEGPGKTTLGAGEIITAIRIPRSAAAAKSVFLRKGRIRMDIAIVSLAMMLELDGDSCVRARIAAGAVAPTPIRLRAIEHMLTGAQLDEGLIAEGRRMAQKAVAPLTDVRSTAEYRRHLTGVYFERAVREIIGGTR